MKPNHKAAVLMFGGSIAVMMVQFLPDYALVLWGAGFTMFIVAIWFASKAYAESRAARRP